MLNEGINDPGIFKAVFLAGGPGSGKSFIVGKTALTTFGLKVINSDDAFERGLKKAGLSMDPDDIFSDKGQDIRSKAVKLTGKKLDLALNGRLGLVIDGTGKNYDKIATQAEALRKIGYEVAMIFVNTDLDTAIDRNNKRARSLPTDIVKKMWNDVQKNLGKFQNFFGRHMYIVDNSDGANWEGAVNSAYKRIGAWVKRAPTTPIAKKWLDSNRKQMKEEYQSNVEMAVKALHTLVSRHKGEVPMEHHAITITKAYDLNIAPESLLEKYKLEYNVKEELGMTTTAVAGAGDDGIVAVDRRIRKDKPPRLLKRFRGWMKKDDDSA